MVVWVKWARPLSLWHCDPELCSIEKRFYSFHGRPTPLKVNGSTLGRSCTPGVQLLPHLRYGLTEPASLSRCVWFIKFLRNSRSELRPAKVCPMHCQWDFWAIICPWGEHRTPIAYKSHSTPFPIRPHVLTPHSWLCDKNCGRSSAPKKKWRKKKNNNKYEQKQ